MIERLMNPERSYGEPTYSTRAKEIAMLRQMLTGQLDQEGRKSLEQLEDSYIRQETSVVKDAFADGFWTAVELLRDFQHWKMV